MVAFLIVLFIGFLLICAVWGSWIFLPIALCAAAIIILARLFSCNSLGSVSHDTQTEEDEIYLPKYMDNYEKEARDYWTVQYNPIVQQHYKNIEQIEAMYSVLYNLRDYHSDKTEAFIKLCKKDMETADEFVRLHKRHHQEYPKSYVSFKRLAMIYEKQGEYDKAIEACARAIKLGLDDDGTSGKMYGRLARMIKKSGSNHPPEYYLNQ